MPQPRNAQIVRLVPDAAMAGRVRTASPAEPMEFLVPGNPISILRTASKRTVALVMVFFTASCSVYQTVRSEAVPPPKEAVARAAAGSETAPPPTGATARARKEEEPGGVIYALPRTLLQLTTTIDSAGAVTYAPTILTVGDMDARYRIRLAPSPETDNQYDFKIDANGLLQSASANITDRTGEIIAAVAKTVAAAASPPTAGFDVSRAGASQARTFSRLFDVYSSVGRGYTDIEKGGAKIRFDLVKVDANGVLNSAALSSADQTCSYAVCFRSLIPVMATIADKLDGPPTTQFLVATADASRSEGIDLPSAFLVARTNLIEFTNGSPTHININQPSTNLALASLPLTVITAVMQSLFTLHISYVNAQKNSLSADTDLQNQITALKAAIKQNANTGGGP